MSLETLGTTVEFEGDWEDFVRPVYENIDDLETCYQMFFPRRDFWEDHFNKSVLQQILDLKFNTQPINEYVAEKDHYQQKIRLKVLCTVCRCDLKGYDPFMSHNDGKAHKKMRQSQVISSVPLRPNQDITSVQLWQSQRLHKGGLDKEELTLKSLSEPRNFFKVGTLEFYLDTSSSSIVGVGFVYRKDIHKMPTFTCDLCKVNCLSQKKISEHLQDTYHALLYMRVKFRRDVATDNLARECRKVVKNEGRISNVILDFSDRKHAAVHVRSKSRDVPQRKCVEGYLPMVKKRELDAWTQKTSAYYDIATFTALHQVYVGHVANDLNKWSLILECLFYLEMNLARYYARTANFENLEHAGKTYSYLAGVYNYSLCVVSECQDWQL
nr:uncharacterized protein LOC123758535 [Procambarus clarkii]